MPDHQSPVLNLNDYDYDLPSSLIAQRPSSMREMSRLLQFNPATNQIQHRSFKDLVHILEPGDTVVINDSRVIPARIWGKKVKTGRLVEFLWLEETSDGWKGLLRGKNPVASEIIFGSGEVVGQVFSKNEDGTITLKISSSIETLSFLEKYGEPPLPPYIHRDPDLILKEDKERYQTVFSKSWGSVAAPTAGLHFSPSLMDEMSHRGIHFVKVTHHVGLGTFQPLKEETLQKGKLHCEKYEISQVSAFQINQAVSQKRRILVVGTTTARCLESSVGLDGKIRSGNGVTDLFIYPPYQFKIVKNLLTNFHLPKSSLLMLVSALIGRQKRLSLYQEAIQNQYRFYSYGDAMLILI
ncbi:MAG: tRNA preQ1(34) S-adenosylmethionine ribosyltransferase-isomerase QueA [Chlamydiae bacterium]|nr:tRNA preQ1(34) S-adenosylmethionine ribosyltransferase-isomerase QueA [Chlamydiota bacterium]MBI3276821.1 tRNA preQ1(34) S-adenosylmethionine ribosyltransferase-isomerase QueA [Chlamydiota bacterium]